MVSTPLEVVLSPSASCRWRPASSVVARVIRPKFVRRDRERDAETEVLIAPPPELPIPRGLAGPGMLVDTIVKRWQDHMPLNRLEQMYAREGLALARSTMCGWHGARRTRRRREAPRRSDARRRLQAAVSLGFGTTRIAPFSSVKPSIIQRRPVAFGSRCGVARAHVAPSGAAEAAKMR